MARSSSALKATPPVKQINAPETTLKPHDFVFPSSAALACAGSDVAAAALLFSSDMILRPIIPLPLSLCTGRDGKIVAQREEKWTLS